MEKPKTAILVERLHQSTVKGAVPWEETEEKGVYQAAFPPYSIRISERDDGTPEPDYVLSIYNEEGTLVDEIVPSVVHEYIPSGESYRLFKSMYETARRIAMGLEAALDKILEALPDDDTDIPF